MEPTGDPAKDAEALIALLRELGHPEQAQAIDDAIAGGSTGTEILVRLIGAAKQLQRERGLDARVVALARAIIKGASRDLRI